MATTSALLILLSLSLLATTVAFGPKPLPIRSTPTSSTTVGRLVLLFSSPTANDESPPPRLPATEAMAMAIDPKEAVKIFGRLAEKYIMLDSSGGMCCYSACSDCEYRLPGGGYIMADMSASRPKWIPNYDYRSANGKEHSTVWSSALLFKEGPAVTKEAFVTNVVELGYAPPLGGPYVGASAAEIEDTTAAAALFDVLAEGKKKLTKHRMSLRLKELADGEEGLTWAGFSSALGL